MRRLMLSWIVLLAAMVPVEAACTITGLVSATGTTIAAGTYSGSNLVVPVSITMTVLKPIGDNGNCSGRAAFKGANALAATPRMIDIALHNLNYTLPGYYTSTLGTTFPVSGQNNSGTTFTSSFSTTLTIPANQIAASGTPNGGYADITVSLVVFDGASSTTPAGAFPVTISATVANPSTCTIGGSANASAASLNFSNGAAISTATQTANFGAVTCNNPATLTLTSSNGAAKTSSAASGTYKNFFDYIASTTVNSGTVTLNTSSLATAVGPESSTGRITATTTTNAPLAINVTPIAPSSGKLVAGSYSDVLTITITPD